MGEDVMAAFARIAEQIAAGATVAASWRLPGGISAAMTALELRLPDGGVHRVIVRQLGQWAQAEYAHPAEREYHVLEVVRGAGVAAPSPVLFDESGALLPGPYLVMDYIEGRVEHSPADVGAYVGQLAAALASIHRIAGARPELAGLPAWPDWLAGARAERPNEPDEPLGPRRIRAVLRDVAADGGALPHPNAPALLHGDAWPGNILWRDGRLAALVDWEEAHVGDPLEDLAIARFDVLCMLGQAGLAGLTGAYQALRPEVDFRALPYWDLYAALRPVGHLAAWAGGWADLGRPDLTADVLGAHHRWFVEQALVGVGALDLRLLA